MHSGRLPRASAKHAQLSVANRNTYYNIIIINRRAPVVDRFRFVVIFTPGRVYTFTKRSPPSILPTIPFATEGGREGFVFTSPFVNSTALRGTIVSSRPGNYAGWMRYFTVPWWGEGFTRIFINTYRVTGTYVNRSAAGARRRSYKLCRRSARAFTRTRKINSE